jgi:hypothetical protein
MYFQVCLLVQHDHGPANACKHAGELSSQDSAVLEPQDKVDMSAPHQSSTELISAAGSWWTAVGVC